MKFGLIIILSAIAGVLSGEHFHSFMVGFGVASLAVGAGYWLSFRCSTRYPQLAVLMLLLGVFAKIAVTITGVMWGLEANLISSPFIFSLSYLFFSLVATYGYFKLREYQLAQSAQQVELVAETA
ncbi:NADH:ubiquinone oxidoreductase [Photobacterium sanctipauli]|uniref:NADH:ubiquinone oxidoreductase n=1 Tax=Photobacterium sanctipauli TaxID=1342794 RepID=A0A2T3NUZ4_9GAMM|nr:hypothetical protein [Photobacterium sanctipauli]PSW20094.1 NADH:ubiquinone oxidoreductase [Photobacterium sanctipauli]